MTTLLAAVAALTLSIAHRRPNLATAPSIRSNAIPTTPAPAIPHTVEVFDGDAELAGGVLAARGGADRGHVIAGQRLVARRHQRLHLGILARHQPVDRGRLERHLPAGRRARRELDVVGRCGTGVADDDRNRTLLRRNRPRAQEPVAAGDLELRLTHDIKRNLDIRRSILGVDRHLDRKMPGIDRARWTNF